MLIVALVGLDTERRAGERRLFRTIVGVALMVSALLALLGTVLYHVYRWEKVLDGEVEALVEALLRHRTEVEKLVLDRLADTKGRRLERLCTRGYDLVHLLAIKTLNGDRETDTYLCRDE